MEEDQVCWDVQFYWKDARGDVGTSLNTSFHKDMTIMEVIATCANWRNVDLSTCTCVEARRIE